MLDRLALRLTRPAVMALARPLARAGVSANALTWIGFAIGLLAAGLISQGAFLSALLAMGASRLCDALDGAVARQTQATDLGGFLDITLDFVFYASIPLGFALADPAKNALAAAVLLASFVGTASSFLAFAVLAAKRGLHNRGRQRKSQQRSDNRCCRCNQCKRQRQTKVGKAGTQQSRPCGECAGQCDQQPGTPHEIKMKRKKTADDGNKQDAAADTRGHSNHAKDKTQHEQCKRPNPPCDRCFRNSRQRRPRAQ
jgi:phosphatidylglycerophosphate synthase